MKDQTHARVSMCMCVHMKKLSTRVCFPKEIERYPESFNFYLKEIKIHEERGIFTILAAH